MKNLSWKLTSALVLAMVLVGMGWITPTPVARAQSGLVAGASPSWITGDGSAHALGSGGARWVKLVAPTGNSTVVYAAYGTTASATNGTPIAPGGSDFSPPLSPGERYDLSKISYLAANGDKLSYTVIY